MVNAESSSSQNQNASSYPYKNNNVNILSNLDSTHGYVDLKCIKGKSLRERFHELLSSSSSTSSVSIKYELDNRIDRFKEACLQLIGKDSISLKELGTSAIFILLGDMGDQFVELISRSVSVVDIPRHCSLKQFKPKILCKIGASGAVNVDLAWIDVCKCLGSLLAYHPFKTVDREQFSELFRQCRVVSQNEELILKLVNNNYNSTSSSHKQRKAFHRSTSSKKNPGEKRNGSVEKQEDGCSYALQEDDVTDPFRRLLLAPLLEQNKKKSINQPEAASSSSTSLQSTSLSMLTNKLSHKARQLDISDEQFIQMIFDILASSKSSDEVQEELFELIGLDCVDIVFDLVNRRDEWINVYFPSDDQKSAEEASCTDQNQVKNDQKGSNAALIERLLTDPISASNSIQARIEVNANQTMERLRKALANRSTSSQLNTMPYVFDASAELRKTVNIGDTSKLLLPENVKFQQSTICDQVDFPLSSKPPEDLLNVERVKIKSLDEVGQMVFQGIKELNLIQSVVYPTAYHTSENLLVSAPTGAGKTNVALLTIVHLLRSHMKGDNVLDLKAFKIVYLAPMKALAAEMADTFSKRLSPLGVRVRECTGDIQLSKQEILETQMLVSTPEKWDVISRKGTGDATLVKLVKLLIIDEVHLLHEDRGAVIEALVARTLRQVESSQTMIRLVGLSATLPNYIDVARFLCVNLQRGLFYFDSRFRPVPLGMSFIGIRGANRRVQDVNMSSVCYDKVLEQVKKGEQVMVFVHARGDTFRTARGLRTSAQQLGHMAYFRNEDNSSVKMCLKKIQKSSDSAIKDLVPDGFACHHAGMLRVDRSLVEKLFADGYIRVLVCTATLAWGVNLPAHAVIIKGTRVYKAEKSDFDNLDVLDVLQIFGRAGRPQFDTYGQATLITTQDSLVHYLRLITNQGPIESTLLANLHDHLNAEIALGTVSNIDEAVTWLSYTYLFIRLRQNPLQYGLTTAILERDPDLVEFLGRVVRTCATDLDSAEMIRYEPATGQLASTDRGRTASLYYIRYATAAMVKDALEPTMMIPQIFTMLSEAAEFASMKVREEEGTELVDIKNNVCHLPIQQAGTVDTDVVAKVNVLLQGYISRHMPSCHSLMSDMNFVQQNAGRLVRYLFEISLRQGWSQCASITLTLAKMFEQRLWDGQSPLWQFVENGKQRLIQRVEELHLSIDRIREIDVNELAFLFHYQGKEGAREISRLASYLPRIQLDVESQPITRTILRVKLTLQPDFTWSNHIHGLQQSYWVWIEDPDQGVIFHSEYWTLNKRMYSTKTPQVLNFTIPLYEPYPNQYFVRVLSDCWLGADSTCPVSFKRLILPSSDPPHTDLLRLQPLPITALKNSNYELLYNFTHFNPIQTQLFHTLYHQNVNVLLGAPTGSGKTVAAELAIFRVFNESPKQKCVYIAPLKALVRERIEDWSIRIGQKLKKRVVELTGDVTPDIQHLLRSDLIVTTPEKWDGISRSWQHRSYVRQVALIVIDEIHLLGEERGPVLEVLVSRANYIANQLGQSVRIIGLSTALANAPDLAAWLHIPSTMTSISEVASISGVSYGLTGRGLFNFRPSVRPVPLEVHIQGYPGRHYCPRMATMNRPIYQAIRSHSPTKPVLIFVSSRRQTRLTALDLVSFVAASEDSKCWLHMKPEEMELICENIQEANLRLTLTFGIGLHHAGLQNKDRSLVEELFANQKIQILIATSTLAWGVNFPAHLVIVKGTEYYDGKTKTYVDYPITDVLQMMGRAGRPQFDDQGKAVIMVQNSKKTFYKRFLYEPFPVESYLIHVLPDHLNAEIVAGTVTTMQEALDYLTWTFFFRRLYSNPCYYGLEDCEPQSVNTFLSGIITSACQHLAESSCLHKDAISEQMLVSTPLGRLASYYYLSHLTMKLFTSTIRPTSDVHELLKILSNAHEYYLLPVRHNEDEMNKLLANQLPLPAIGPMDSPHTKTHLLFQAHFSRIEELPIVDYKTDTRSVLDQAIRILQAMLDVSAECGWLRTCLNCILLMQMITQGLWVEEYGSSLLQLPRITREHLDYFRGNHNTNINSLPELIDYVASSPNRLDSMLRGHMEPNIINLVKQAVKRFPLIEIHSCLIGPNPSLSSSLQSTVREFIINNKTGQSSNCLTVYSDIEYVLRIELLRSSLDNEYYGNKPVITASLIKSKSYEGWFLLLGNCEVNINTGGELLVLKRVPPKSVVIHKKHHTSKGKHFINLMVKFPPPITLTPSSADSNRGVDGIIPSLECRQRYQLTLFLMSDTYLGLDQQIDLLFDVIRKPPPPPPPENDKDDGDFVGDDDYDD
uniref:Activating signal cointegrator 1 complex subunit 3 n=1 Tax=Trichobilharzia regenti TaxID=157069 RepID=A0AA85J1R0_TRIRE